MVRGIDKKEPVYTKCKKCKGDVFEEVNDPETRTKKTVCIKCGKRLEL